MVVGLSSWLELAPGNTIVVQKFHMANLSRLLNPNLGSVFRFVVLKYNPPFFRLSFLSCWFRVSRRMIHTMLYTMQKVCIVFSIFPIFYLIAGFLIIVIFQNPDTFLIRKLPSLQFT